MKGWPDWVGWIFAIVVTCLAAIVISQKNHAASEACRERMARMKQFVLVCSEQTTVKTCIELYWMAQNGGIYKKELEGVQK